MKNKVAIFLEYVVYIGIFAYYIAVFFPGYYTADSFYTISMALHKETVTNWHPAILINMWRWIYNLTYHIEFIWIVQIFLLFNAIKIVSKIFDSKLIKLIFPILMLLWPSLFSSFGAVWKDIWTIIFMLYAIGFSILAYKNLSINYSIVSILSIIIVWLLRVDYFITAGVFLIFPLIIIYKIYFYQFKKYFAYPFMLILIFILFVVIKSIFELTTVEVKKNPWSTLVVWDIVGTYVQMDTKEDIVIGSKIIDYNTYSSLYNIKTSDSIAFEGNIFGLDLPQNQQNIDNYKFEKDKLLFFWMNTILHNPFEYLKHRFDIFKNFIGFNNAIHHPYPFGINNNSFNLLFFRTPLNIDIYWFIDSHANGYFWRLWLYVLISTVFLFFLKNKDNFFRLSLGIFYISLLGCLFRVFVLPAADFRYGIYIVVITLVMASYLVDYYIKKYLKI